MNNKSLHLDIIAIKEFFGEEPVTESGSSSFNIKADNNKIKIHLEIFPDNQTGNYLISVYTNNCHLQLHDCTRVIQSDMLEELLFISEDDNKLSGLIISKNGDCAMYSDVLKKDINSDLAELSSEKLLAAVALSIADI
ncbi:MAG: hypothetical protein OZ913_04135 [Ignavibacteriaceae bacterium]|nr:MAG: hypothetical protein UZ04_CHB001001865 [Chlorobi bacterium OLB4]MBV6398803.1 hypothetical protein [Ignavibacteria bacterium]MCC6885025.1 hypothetical protein [Ignavibacteriales bacterium]MCE7952184.1 hypothetical protein [Chlorobi bacterium CHB7]MDL1886259.1 hypothetical protein [Ignavibacteria bacterium CHB1]MEB2329470.1 hypothetical protein [Ignavibacteriaceae bacterium]OQY78977.1 MAG: hypothetical protein B6D43_01230 [Ignavibacteriales bacterium UTCHB1]RIK49416.1 MAG: hypothetical